MINLNIPGNKPMLIKYNALTIFKDNYIFFKFFLQRILNRLIFKSLYFIKRCIRNFLKSILSCLYRLDLNFLANKLLYLYRIIRQKNNITYNSEHIVYNNTIINRLDYHFKYSRKSQVIFNDLKSAIKNSKAINL